MMCCVVSLYSLTQRGKTKLISLIFFPRVSEMLTKRRIRLDDLLMYSCLFMHTVRRTFLKEREQMTCNQAEAPKHASE